MMSALLSLLALSLDIGLLYTARSEAQRAADAAALAGASAFLNYAPNDPAVEWGARQRALQYATANDILGDSVRPSEVTDTVDWHNPDRWVRVTIRRDSISLWFAKLFGVTSRAVAASATAGAVPADNADCVAPLAFLYDDFADYWQPPPQGLHGRPVTIGHAQGPPPQQAESHREYLVLDESASSWASSWSQTPSECHSRRISIRDTVIVHPSPDIVNGWAQRMPQDNAHWDSGQRQVIGGDGWNSPRIITVMLYEPINTGGETSTVIVRDFLLFFVESPDVDGTAPGRFLAYASGTGAGLESQTALTMQLTR